MLFDYLLTLKIFVNLLIILQILDISRKKVSSKNVIAYRAQKIVRMWRNKKKNLTDFGAAIRRSEFEWRNIF